MACHQDVASQLDGKTGLHGRLEQPRECAKCHPDHRGRDFNPAQAALATFDHQTTRFALTGTHGTLTCQRCHAKDYASASSDCASCHQEPAAHRGMFSTDCAACHTTFAWQPANMNGQLFEHNQASFSLVRHARDYTGAALICTSCHTSQNSLKVDAQVCQACHARRDASFMQKHTSLYGGGCLTCHDGVDRLHGFTHQAVFPLEGKHNLACERCHANQQFHGTSPRCASCHQEPAIHTGYFGARCDYCHTNQAWRPALLRAHTFPLDHGGKGEVTCQTCHPASYAANRCDTCHEHAADTIARSHARLNLSPEKLASCLDCHLDGKK